MKMASHKFGKEIRLMGEMLITAEKVGAGKDFFSFLAHNENLFWKVLELSRVKPIFNVTVDYTNSAQATVDVYSRSGSLGSKHKGTTDLDKFTIDVAQGLIQKKLLFEVEMTLFWFNQRVNSDQVIEEMEKEDCRPAAVVELHAFERDFPNIQKKIPIVGLGTVVKPDDCPAYVPYLDYVGDRHERIFRFIHRAPQWDTFVRFAAVPEEIV